MPAARPDRPRGAGASSSVLIRSSALTSREPRLSRAGELTGSETQLGQGGGPAPGCRSQRSNSGQALARFLPRRRHVQLARPHGDPQRFAHQRPSSGHLGEAYLPRERPAALAGAACRGPRTPCAARRAVHPRLAARARRPAEPCLELDRPAAFTSARQLAARCNEPCAREAFLSGGSGHAPSSGRQPTWFERQGGADPRVDPAQASSLAGGPRPRAAHARIHSGDDA